MKISLTLWSSHIFQINNNRIFSSYSVSFLYLFCFFFNSHLSPSRAHLILVHTFYCFHFLKKCKFTFTIKTINFQFINKLIFSVANLLVQVILKFQGILYFLFQQNILECNFLPKQCNFSVVVHLDFRQHHNCCQYVEPAVVLFLF